ncbi:response regulator [Kaistia terrae]|uniref:Response regulator n=1 Tax=Kaistia terrae TaxID=537017 RepID=A0ABW0Q1C1_9HYPH|nr:response regulator transcription factor [Kaistia terrae]MCX5578646.1 response regulator transcription factor [Kaistia terrae]
MTLRLVIVDDHLIVLDGLRRMIETEPGWSVTAICQSAAHAIEVVEAQPVDMVVLDLRMPEMGGLDLIRRLRAYRPTLPLVVLTADISDEDLAEATRLGVNGVVLKEQAPTVLLDCIRTVFAGETYFADQSLEAAFDRLHQRDVERDGILKLLTPREVEVSRLAAAGFRSRDIGSRLGISPGTVKLHLHSIYSKLDITSRVELANLSQRMHLDLEGSA